MKTDNSVYLVIVSIMKLNLSSRVYIILILEIFSFSRIIADERLLNRVDLTETNKYAVCNDGTPAAYYFRQGTGEKGSKRWVIWLKGGGWCWDDHSCLTRRMYYRSSKWLPQTMNNDFILNESYHQGILSTDAVLNPYFADANHVYLWYCSSDSHLGNTSINLSNTQFHFRGKQIVNTLIHSVTKKYSFISNASLILIAGDSAGGVGVLNNIDYISQLLGNLIDSEKFSQIKIRGLVDAGFFMDFRVYNVTIKKEYNKINYSTIAKEMTKKFNMKWNDKCYEFYSKIDTDDTNSGDENEEIFFNGTLIDAGDGDDDDDDDGGDETVKLTTEEWKCFHAQYMIRYVKTPLLFHEYSYDSVNLGYYSGIGVIDIDNKAKMSYMQEFRDEMEFWQDVKLNMSYLFRPACYRHEIIDGKFGGLNDIKIDKNTFYDVLESWLELDDSELIYSYMSAGYQESKVKNLDGFRHVDKCSTFSCNKYCNDEFYASHHKKENKLMVVLIVLFVVVCGLAVMLFVARECRGWKKGIKRKQFQKVEDMEMDDLEDM